MSSPVPLIVKGSRGQVDYVFSHATLNPPNDLKNYSTVGFSIQNTANGSNCTYKDELANRSDFGFANAAEFLALEDRRQRTQLGADLAPLNGAKHELQTRSVPRPPDAPT